MDRINLVIDGNVGRFNDSADPGGNPPSDWGIVKQVYSGGTPSNQGGDFTRITSSGSLVPFEGSAMASATYSGSTLPEGLINGWLMNTSITVEQNKEYFIQGYFSKISGSASYDNIKPFIYPQGYSLEDLTIQSEILGDVTAEQWIPFIVTFNSGANTSIKLMMGGENLIPSGSSGSKVVAFDFVEMFGPIASTTQTQTICKKDVCVNPFYVKWLNSLGGWSYWMFQYEQFTQTKLNVGEEIGKRVTDLSLATQFLRTAGNSYRDEIRVQATNLTENQYEALKEIAGSKQVYRMFQDGSQIGLQVIRFLNDKSQRSERHVLEFVFQVPETVFQSE